MRGDYAIDRASGDRAVIVAISRRALAWLAENLTYEDHYWRGPCVSVRWNFVENLVLSMRGAGLVRRH